ncbi:hypothetical protein ACFRFU_32705 [Streptomyces sp. NPDC056704]|uniref:hypothetical protein n=1 Tax=Streptomyces sp. NPDC056704 TaxID=3345917 RepID=UPI003695E7BF
MTAEIAGISPRRGGCTRRDPRATLVPDLVERDFTAPTPNRLWVTDLTVITTGEGPLWLSATGMRSPAGWSPARPPHARTQTWS